MTKDINKGELRVKSHNDKMSKRYDMLRFTEIEESFTFEKVTDKDKKQPTSK